MREKAEKKSEKKDNKGWIAAAIVGGVVAVVAIVGVVIGVTSGGEKEPEYSKKTETYVAKNEKRGSEVSFEFAAEELGYEAKDYTNGIEFTNPEDKSSIRIRVYDEYYKNLIKDEDAFSTKSFRDYVKGEFAGHEGYKIVKFGSLASSIEMALVLDMYDSSKSRVDGVAIQIVQSPMQPREEEFNSEKFFESEDFQHLLKTLKLKVNEAEE